MKLAGQKLSIKLYIQDNFEFRNIVFQLNHYLSYWLRKIQQRSFCSERRTFQTKYKQAKATLIISKISHWIQFPFTLLSSVTLVVISNYISKHFLFLHFHFFFFCNMARKFSQKCTLREALTLCSLIRFQRTGKFPLLSTV